MTSIPGGRVPAAGERPQDPDDESASEALDDIEEPGVAETADEGYDERQRDGGRKPSPDLPADRADEESATEVATEEPSG